MYIRMIVEFDTNGWDQNYSQKLQDAVEKEIENIKKETNLFTPLNVYIRKSEVIKIR